MPPTSTSSSKWLTKPIKALLLDITGVLYESGTTCAIDGSVEAISKLRKHNIPFRLVTNETQKGTLKIIEKLNNFGYDFQENEIITPSMICRKFILENGLRPHFLIHPNLKSAFDDIDCNDPNCVIIGDAEQHFTYDSMNECFRLLMSLKNCDKNENNDNLLISLGINKYYRERNQLKMDLGGYTVALEYVTDLKAKIIGKPSKDYFDAAIKTFGEELLLTVDDICMIGDDIIGDVQGAQNAGVRGILVRTGKYLPINENHPLVKPDAIVDNLKDAIDQIIKNQYENI